MGNVVSCTVTLAHNIFVVGLLFLHADPPSCHSCNRVSLAFVARVYYLPVFQSLQVAPSLLLAFTFFVEVMVFLSHRVGTQFI
jgi:hypothetical protein